MVVYSIYGATYSHTHPNSNKWNKAFILDHAMSTGTPQVSPRAHLLRAILILYGDTNIHMGVSLTTGTHNVPGHHQAYLNKDFLFHNAS